MFTLLETVFTNPIVAFILLVGVVVFVHELGHYLAGRLVGVDVEEFSLGFGPKAIGFRHGITEFKICWLPLGGYVRFYGSEIGNEPPPERRHRALLSSPVYKRATISVAGPLANFILSFAVMVALSAWGMPQPSPVVSVLEGSPAAQGGLRDGDRVLAIGDEKVHAWSDLTRIISASAGKTLRFRVARGGGEEVVTVVPSVEETQSHFGDTVRSGRIGVMQFLLSPRLAVREGSLLWNLGFRSGDVVVSIDGKPVKYGWEVRDAFGQTFASLNEALVQQPSRSVPVVVRRVGSGRGGVPEETGPSLETVLAAVSKPTASKAPEGELTLDLANAAAFASLSKTSTPGIPGSGGLPLLSFTEMTLGGFDELPRADPRLPSREALKSCGLQVGDTFVSFGESAVLSSPVQMNVWIEKTTRSANALLEGKSVAEVGTANRVNVPFRVFGWNGALRDVSCVVELRKSKDAFGRDAWVFDWPLRFFSAGVSVPPVVVRSEGVMEALADGGAAVLDQAGTIFTGLSKLMTGGIPLSNLGGPIAIARVAGDAASGGALIFILTISWMSVNIGMFNLLPLPALDGGSLLLHGFEAAYGKPLPVNVQAAVQRAGVLLILVIFVVVFYNDILRLFTPS
jgi:regulator of sigma E protease